MVQAIEVVKPRIVGRSLKGILDNFGEFWRVIVRDGQLRWVILDFDIWVLRKKPDNKEMQGMSVRPPLHLNCDLEKPL